MLNRKFKNTTPMTLALLAVEKGFLTDPENRNADGTINWDFVTGDLWGEELFQYDDKVIGLLDWILKCMEDTIEILHEAAANLK